MTSAEDESAPASPYSTGGGGTVLEHRYGAVLLAGLLIGDPLTELGDDATPKSVSFQASAFSAVDDLVVEGIAGDGAPRRVSIGVRRAPAMTQSDASSQRLLESYVRVVVSHRGELDAGRWRLALAVASPNQAVSQIADLAEIARASSPEQFHADVIRPGRTNAGVRSRLNHLDALVRGAISGGRIDPGGMSDAEVTWRLLYALRKVELRLEGADMSDRTNAVARLRLLTGEQTASAADALFSRLAELAGRYAPAAARATATSLRGDLVGIRLARSPSYRQAWDVLDGLARRLHDHTRFDLATPGVRLELARADERNRLAAAMAVAGEGLLLVVSGEPDVGKSSLALRASEQLDEQQGVIVSLSLRELPATLAEFESLLGAPLRDVLAAAATGPIRLIVVDGAEAVLEGRSMVLTDLSTAALRAGLGVVAVTRSDAARAARDALRRAAEAAGVPHPGPAHVVLRLTVLETAEVLDSFPALARLRGDDRTAWVLGRPGLVDLLLRSDAILDPAQLLSEADVFTTIWYDLVRRRERTLPDGATPDAREGTMVALARQRLLSNPSSAGLDPVALPSLRSDGLLLAIDPTSLWGPQEEFASDLIRDLAITRLLTNEGWRPLLDSGAPRWAIRAVRLACQAALSGSSQLDSAWACIQTTFADVASQHGQRWSEIPLEAILTLGDAESALAHVWPALLASGRAGLHTLLRLASQRYTHGGFGDPVILAPLVALSYCGADDLGHDDRYSYGTTGAAIRELVLNWLRGLVKADSGPHPLRQRVRDRLLARNPEPYDDFAIEAIAMLGPDLNDHAETFLRGMMTDNAARLAPAVESIGAVLSMPIHRPQLMLALAESYYIEVPDPESGWGGGFLDDGIRRHRPTGGFGFPMVAWYYGPFFRLLNVAPVEALRLVNRMLDHAATVRVQNGRRLPSSDEPPSEFDLDLYGVGVRRCVGDSHVWSWYRGSSVGPYPCMSALLAVERYADHLVDTLGLPLRPVVEAMLRECRNLAMPGLVVGFLVRHLSRADDLLDRWLTIPAIWSLEFSRLTGEGQNVQGPDPSDLVGQDKRASSFRDVAAEMTLRAAVAGDQDRLAALEAVAEELLRRGLTVLEGRADSEQRIAALRGWAATFTPANYRASTTDEGQVVVQYEAPNDVAIALAPSLESISIDQEAMRLQAAYTADSNTTGEIGTLVDDLAVARRLATQPSNLIPFNPYGPVAAVAAAAVMAHARGDLEIAANDLEWAATQLIAAAQPRSGEPFDDEQTTFPMGADRSAASGLPSLTLPPFDSLDINALDLYAAIRRCTTSPSDEVRDIAATAMAPAWNSVCRPLPGSQDCLHLGLWTAVTEGLADCRLSDWNQEEQRRGIDPLAVPYELTLRIVRTDAVLVNRLVAPLISTASATMSHSCVADRAQTLLPVLLEVHRRAANHWAEKGYAGYPDRQRKLVAQTLISLLLDGSSEALIEHARLFAHNPRGLQELLHDIALVFTYDDTLRPNLLPVWREVMAAVLNEVDAGANLREDHQWSDYAIASLIPTPQPAIADPDPDATLRRARDAWLVPDEIVTIHLLPV